MGILFGPPQAGALGHWVVAIAGTEGKLTLKDTDSAERLFASKDELFAALVPEYQGFRVRPLTTMTVAALRNECKDRRLSTTGRKSELIDRMKESAYRLCK